MTRPDMPPEIWAQCLTYDSGELLVDAYDREFERGIRYVRADLVSPDQKKAALEAFERVKTHVLFQELINESVHNRELKEDLRTIRTLLGGGG